MRPIWNGIAFDPHHPWSKKRKLRARVAAKKRIALKKKQTLEAELKELTAFLEELDWQEEVLNDARSS